MNDYSFEDIELGQIAAFDLMVDQSTVDAFANLSGDYNPLHLDEEYAESTKYGRRIAHGMLLGCYLSRLVGTMLPGKRCLLMSQSIDFTAPVCLPARLYIKGWVLRKVESERVIAITVTFSVDGKRVARGRAIVSIL